MRRLYLLRLLLFFFSYFCKSVKSSTPAEIEDLNDKAVIAIKRNNIKELNLVLSSVTSLSSIKSEYLFSQAFDFFPEAIFLFCELGLEAKRHFFWIPSDARISLSMAEDLIELGVSRPEAFWESAIRREDYDLFWLLREQGACTKLYAFSRVSSLCLEWGRVRMFSDLLDAGLDVNLSSSEFNLLLEILQSHREQFHQFIPTILNETENIFSFLNCPYSITLYFPQNFDSLLCAEVANRFSEGRLTVESVTVEIPENFDLSYSPVSIFDQLCFRFPGRFPETVHWLHVAGARSRFPAAFDYFYGDAERIKRLIEAGFVNLNKSVFGAHLLFLAIKCCQKSDQEIIWLVKQFSHAIHSYFLFKGSLIDALWYHRSDSARELENFVNLLVFEERERERSRCFC